MSQLWSLLLYARYECGCPSVNTLITSHYAISPLIGAYNKISVVIGPKTTCSSPENTKKLQQ